MKPSMKSLGVFNGIVAVALVGFCISCQFFQEKTTEQDYATRWSDMALYITKNTPGNSPTYASRCLGYIGLTMYESVVHSDQTYASMAGQLDSLKSLPMPQPNQTYDWLIALNASQAHIIKALYKQTSDVNKTKIDSLENAFLEARSANITDPEITKRSIAYGRAVAEKIFEWSKTDGGNEGYFKNFDKKRVYPQKLGGWQPPLYSQSISRSPLHPDWGKNRTFLIADHKIAAPKPIPFDSVPQSEYYQQFLAVYRQRNALTQQQKEAAVWWGDDPDETFTPPGHSYYIATLVIKKINPPLIKCAETYARVGMGVADAFVNCWKWKYQFFTERPNTFIPKYIDKFWESFWPDPPFPAFPSGHAIQAAATATVLGNLYGNSITITDDSHVGRKPDGLRNVEFKARTFNALWDVANEVANSRFYGGIHTPMDNNAGLQKGKEIGENINSLTWQKSLYKKE